MVVEDELALREILKATLEQAQYRVTAFSNGIEALEAVQRSQCNFELVLTDFEMPFMAGSVLVEQLTARLPSVPFVIMTGSLEVRGYQDHALDGKQHLVKPFTTQALLQIVQEAIAVKNVGPGSSSATASA